MQNAHHTIWGSSDINSRGKDLLAYCASAEADINEFQPFKASGPDGLYPVLLQKGCESTERILPCHFSSMPETQQCAIGHGKKAQVYFSPNWGKESPYNHFNFFSTEMVGKASSVSY